MKPYASALLLAALLAATTSDLAAQRRHRSEFVRVPSGAFAGGSLAYARPQGEFRDFVDRGFGGAAHFIWQPGRRGPLGLRVDGSFLNYGSERQRVPLSPTIGGRITVDLNTTNNIAFLGVGPQLGLPDGRLRPYVGGFAGVSYLFTESSLSGAGDEHTFARTSNLDDATFSYGGRAGIYVPVSRGHTPVSIDLGATYLNSGEAEYLREGDIHDHPDGTISFTPSRSETDLLTFHVGISVGIPRTVRR